MEEEGEERDEVEEWVSPSPPRDVSHQGDEVVLQTPRRGFLSRKSSTFRTAHLKRSEKQSQSRRVGTLLVKAKEDDPMKDFSTSVRTGINSRTTQSHVATKLYQQPQLEHGIHDSLSAHVAGQVSEEPAYNGAGGQDKLSDQCNGSEQPVPVTYILSGKSRVKKIREIPALTSKPSLTGSLSNRSLGSYTKPEPRRLIQAPYLDDIFDDDSSVADSCAEDLRDGEIKWLSGAHRDDRTTTGISTVDGDGSFLGVESVMGDPAAMCGMIMDVVYRDFMNNLQRCGESVGLVREEDACTRDEFYYDESDD